MNLKTFSICLVANLFLFSLPSFAQIPVRLDTQLRDPNGVILEYGVEDGSLHVYQMPDAAPLTTIEIQSTTRSIDFYNLGECRTVFGNGPTKFFMLNPDDFSDLDCPVGTITPNLSLEFLADDLRINGTLLGG